MPYREFLFCFVFVVVDVVIVFPFFSRIHERDLLCVTEIFSCCSFIPCGNFLRSCKLFFYVV